MTTKLITICILLGFLARPSYSQQKQRQTQEKIDYFAKAEKYRQIKNGGMVLTIAGSVLFVAGTITILNSTVEGTFFSESSSADAGTACFLAGNVALAAGIPLWIVGHNNEKKYRKNLQELSVKINATPKSQGLTLTYRF